MICINSLQNLWHQKLFWYLVHAASPNEEWKTNALVKVHSQNNLMTSYLFKTDNVDYDQCMEPKVLVWISSHYTASSKVSAVAPRGSSDPRNSDFSTKTNMNVSLMSPEVMETWLCGCKQLGSHPLVSLTVLKLGGWLAKSFPVWTSQSPLTGICLVELWCLCRDLSQSIAWKKQMCGQIQSDTGTGSCKPFSTKTSHHKLTAGKCTHLTFEWIPVCMQHRLDTEDWRCSK